MDKKCCEKYFKSVNDLSKYSVYVWHKINFHDGIKIMCHVC